MWKIISSTLEEFFPYNHLDLLLKERNMKNKMEIWLRIKIMKIKMKKQMSLKFNQEYMLLLQDQME